MSWQKSHTSAKLVTTEEILTEVLTWFAGKGSVWRAVATKMVRGILANASLRVLPQTSTDSHTALAFYESRLDKEYSLTDCRSIVAMWILGISDVRTNDHHFDQEGFTVVFP